MPSKAMPSKGKLGEIAARAKRYEPEAFAALFDLFFEKMRRYIYFHTGDMEVAEELSSEVFAQALESIDNFEDRGGTIGPWLYGIARNLLAEHFRTVGKVHTLPLEHGSTLPGAEDPEGQVMRGLTCEDLYRAVEHLPDEQREVVILRFIEGYRVKEAAEIMGRSPGAVRALQHRAMVSLRKALRCEVIKG